MVIATTLRFMDAKVDTHWRHRFWGADHYFQLGEKYGVGVAAICSPYNVEEICKNCDGLIVPGSPNNIDPKHYGMPPTDDPLQPYDEYALDKVLIKYFVEHGKPIFGICGGHQELNIYFGGTIKKLDDPEHHKHQSTRLHPINIVEGSFVHDVFGAKRALVNSHHNWEIGRLGDGFTAVATTDDCCIEAIENKKLGVFATQWHPEVYMNLDEHIERRFFDNFLKLCEERR